MSRIGRCEHGRLLRHAPASTASTVATSGRPSGLNSTASHMGSLVPPLWIPGQGPPRSAVSFLASGNLNSARATGPDRINRHKNDHWGANGQEHLLPVRSGPPPYCILDGAARGQLQSRAQAWTNCDSFIQERRRHISLQANAQGGPEPSGASPHRTDLSSARLPLHHPCPACVRHVRARLVARIGVDLSALAPLHLQHSHACHMPRARQTHSRL
jgi:hypothetical protein